MVSVIYPDTLPLLHQASECDFLVVGELHGIEQNAKIMQLLIDDAIKIHGHATVAFEWLLTAAESQILYRFLIGETEALVAPQFFSDSDGRVTRSHIELLQHIRNINIVKQGVVDVHFFDVVSDNPEAALAERLLQIRACTNGLVLVETGAVHALKRIDSIPESMTEIMAQQTTVHSVFVRYESGQVAVEGEVYDVRDSASQQALKDGLYDAVIVVAIAEPAIYSAFGVGATDVL